MKKVDILSVAFLTMLLLGAGCAAPGRLSKRAGTEIPALSAAQLLEVADVLTHSGENMRAQQYLQLALRAEAPVELVVPRLLALYVADGQYRLAVDQAEVYLRSHPRDSKVRRLLAALYVALRQDNEAVEQYARVLADAPHDAQTHFALASALHDGGREPLRADEHFRAYLVLEPKGPHAEEARSMLLTVVQ